MPHRGASSMTDGPAFTPLTAPTPALDLGRAADLLEGAYGLDGTLSELGGERDQNVRVDADDGAYVLKISNPADGAGDLDLQNAAMAHVRETDPDLPVMELQETIDGDPWTTIDVDGDECLVRVFTFLPGRIATADELDRDALVAYGADVARVGRALRGFFHPDARYEILWDIRHALRLRDLLDAVDDPARREVAARVLDRFEDRVEPAFDGLRAQVIHNDLSMDNVLFGDDDRVSGIVDFGDLTHTALVCDLAIALARTMRDREADPFAAAEAVTRGYASVTPLESEEARLLGDLTAARLTALATIAEWRVEREPGNADYIAGGLDDAWRQLEELDAVGWDVVGRRLRTAALGGDVPYESASSAEIDARRRNVMGRSPLSYRDPVHVVAGDGVWLYDADGEAYLDAYNNVQVVGHANPAVADAIAGQARTLATNTRYLHEAPVELAERLLATLPDHLDRVLFVNSGSEANEIAWRLATAATGNDGAVVTDHAYHGVTEVTTAMSPKYLPTERRPDSLETVPPPVTDAAGTPGPVDGMADAVAALDDGNGVAAFVFDPLFTSDGIYRPDTAALGRMVDRVRAAGGLVVADEVQAGFGRAGPHLWGFEAAGVTPDVVTFGKPMGNGHPVAAVATSAAVAAPLMERNAVFSTFGGNPVSAVAALAVLDVIEERALVDHAADVGDYLRRGLADLGDVHDAVGEVRGLGLMTGVQLLDGDASAGDLAADVVNGLRERHVLVGSTGEAGDALKIRPPLVFERQHADRLVDELDAVLAAVSR